MISFEQFIKNLGIIKERINKTCERCGRKGEEVSILPVTKGQPAQAIDFAYTGGLKAVGESRVQEVLKKREAFRSEIFLEMIGHLQTNKVKRAVELFDRIQSVDSEKLCQGLNEQANNAGKVMPILLEVNVTKDPSKYGVYVEDSEKLLNCALSLPCLKVEGLMTLAPYTKDQKVTRNVFVTLRKLKERLESVCGVNLMHLSMGMSNDFEIAIEEGSTMVRIGSFLFS